MLGPHQLTKMGPAHLKLVLDTYLWQNADHIGTKKLPEYLASYLYLPRLRDSHVLMEAVQARISELGCDNFAYAGRFDEEKGQYEGLKLAGGGSIVIDSLSVLVKPDIAKAQQAADTADQTGGAAAGGGTGSDTEGGSATTPDADGDATGEADRAARRFFGTVEIDADRAGRDMGRIAEEVLQHLTTLPRSRVRITVEIEAEVPEGVPDGVQRLVDENGQTLRFTACGFERS